jgi:hypothetical protein
VIVDLNLEFEECIQTGLCQGFDSSWEQCAEKKGGSKMGVQKCGSLLEGHFLGIGSCAHFPLVLD